MATTLVPLYQLLKSDATWKWGKREIQAFEVAKSLLISTKVLVHFDSSLDLLLACDASAYGLGAVLSHKMAYGSERPIAFASRVLSA